jgi:hypothetical protein
VHEPARLGPTLDEGKTEKWGHQFRFFTSGSSCNVEICPFSCISTKNECGHADKEVTKIWGFHKEAKRIRRYPADSRKKGRVGGLARPKRVGSLGTNPWDGACRMTWSAQYSIALSLPPVHTPITPSTTSRQTSQGIRFFCLLKRCIPNFRTLLPNLTPSNIVNPRHSIFRPRAPEVDQSTAEIPASYTEMDTCATVKLAP